VFIACVGLYRQPSVWFGEGGKTSDVWLLGSVILGAIIILVNNKLLQDSNTLNWLALACSFLSTASFFVCFAVVSTFRKDELSGESTNIVKIPAVLLLLGFFALFMWPLNSFFFVLFKRSRLEAHQKIISDQKEGLSVEDKGFAARDLELIEEEEEDADKEEEAAEDSQLIFRKED